MTITTRKLWSIASSVQFMCPRVFLHNLCPSFLWSTSWSATLHFIFHTFLQPIFCQWVSFMVLSNWSLGSYRDWIFLQARCSFCCPSNTQSIDGKFRVLIQFYVTNDMLFGRIVNVHTVQLHAFCLHAYMYVFTSSPESLSITSKLFCFISSCQCLSSGCCA